jgi:hypothetical protein
MNGALPQVNGPLDRLPIFGSVDKRDHRLNGRQKD